MTTKNQNLLDKPADVTGVACSDLLGVMVIPSIRDAWDKYLLILATLYMLGTCIWILWDEYGPCFHRKKSNRDDEQSPSQVNNAPGGNLGKLRGGDKNLSLTVRDSDRSVNVRIGGMIGKRLSVLVNQLLKFSRFVHKTRMTPNEKS
jgi:hypothetical protein